MGTEREGGLLESEKESDGAGGGRFPGLPIAREIYFHRVHYGSDLVHRDFMLSPYRPILSLHNDLNRIFQICTAVPQSLCVRKVFWGFRFIALRSHDCVQIVIVTTRFLSASDK